jgi:hypothetical protein
MPKFEFDTRDGGTYTKEFSVRPSDEELDRIAERMQTDGPDVLEKVGDLYRQGRRAAIDFLWPERGGEREGTLGNIGRRAAEAIIPETPGQVTGEAALLATPAGKGVGMAAKAAQLAKRGLVGGGTAAVTDMVTGNDDAAPISGATTGIGGMLGQATGGAKRAVQQNFMGTAQKAADVKSLINAVSDVLPANDLRGLTSNVFAATAKGVQKQAMNAADQAIEKSISKEVRDRTVAFMDQLFAADMPPEQRSQLMKEAMEALGEVEDPKTLMDQVRLRKEAARAVERGGNLVRGRAIREQVEKIESYLTGQAGPEAAAQYQAALKDYNKYKASKGFLGDKALWNPDGTPNMEAMQTRLMAKPKGSADAWAERLAASDNKDLLDAITRGAAIGERDVSKTYRLPSLIGTVGAKDAGSARVGAAAAGVPLGTATKYVGQQAVPKRDPGIDALLGSILTRMGGQGLGGQR